MEPCPAQLSSQVPLLLVGAGELGDMDALPTLAQCLADPLLQQQAEAAMWQCFMHSDNPRVQVGMGPPLLARDPEQGSGRGGAGAGDVALCQGGGSRAGAARTDSDRSAGGAKGLGMAPKPARAVLLCTLTPACLMPHAPHAPHAPCPASPALADAAKRRADHVEPAERVGGRGQPVHLDN